MVLDHVMIGLGIDMQLRLVLDIKYVYRMVEHKWNNDPDACNSILIQK